MHMPEIITIIIQNTNNLHTLSDSYLKGREIKLFDNEGNIGDKMRELTIIVPSRAKENPLESVEATFEKIAHCPHNIFYMLANELTLCYVENPKVDLMP